LSSGSWPEEKKKMGEGKKKNVKYNTVKKPTGENRSKHWGKSKTIAVNEVRTKTNGPGQTNVKRKAG